MKIDKAFIKELKILLKTIGTLERQVAKVENRLNKITEE